ncbi:MAG: MFS transporter [Nocardioidaceae bacterium]
MTVRRAGGADREPARLLLGLAAVAVAFAAADTYVVVLALPDMMSAVELDVDELQRAAPIVSGFLLGYVAILPLIGRISDLRGRTPVLVGSLVVFAIGSVLTAAAYDLDTMVAGRLVQGVGGGGMVPATLALVADLWPAERRGLPLGVVGAVQELGSVLGPLYGALVLAVADWRAIFWLNCAVGLVLVAALRSPTIRAGAADRDAGAPSHVLRDWVGVFLLGGCLACVSLVMLEPGPLVTDLTYGLAFVPVTGGSRWLTPLALAALALAALFVARQLTAHRPLVAWRGWGEVARRTDLLGSALLAVCLGGIIVTFASADPQQQVLSPAAPWLLAGSALTAGLFVWRQRRARHPLVPRTALRERAAWGALVVSFFVGSALIAALVDIPFFARLTIYKHSQLDAALVLVRFLVALPVGAVLGGWLTRRVRAGRLTLAGMLAAAGSFVEMASWGPLALEHWTATIPLVAAGLGFGLAIAPVNAALLASTADGVHGLASGLLVVARMVGMLVGISALTTIGLRQFYAASAEIPPLSVLCPGRATACAAYNDALIEAGLVQLHAVFVGAAVCAALAGVIALWVFGRSRL